MRSLGPKKYEIGYVVVILSHDLTEEFHKKMHRNNILFNPIKNQIQPFTNFFIYSVLYINSPIVRSTGKQYVVALF